MPILIEKTDDYSRKLLAYINVKLALLGNSMPASVADGEFTEIASALIARYREEMSYGMDGRSAIAHTISRVGESVTASAARTELPATARFSARIDSEL